MEGHTFMYNYPDGVLSEQVYFTLTDGEFLVILHSNVTVSPVNDAPMLSGAFVDPPEGSAGTSFNFTVVFLDIDMGSGTPVVEVVIDAVKYRCARDDRDTGPYDEGVVFFLEMDLGSGIHSLYFNAEDGNGGNVTTETLSVAVEEISDTRDKSELTMLISLLIIGAVVLVAILLARRRRLSGSPG